MFQKIIAAGYLGFDPEMRTTTQGKSVANFRMAVGRDDRTEWLTCVAWEKTAELVNDYLRKGSPVLIEGRLQTRKWEDKQGNDRYTTEVVVDRVTFLPDKNREEEQERPAKDKKRTQGRKAERDADADANADAGGFDDDIPFG